CKKAYEFSNVPFKICHKPTREKSPVGKIQPALYQTEDVTCTNSRETLGTPCGKLLFTLKYDRDVEGLIVRVSRVNSLTKFSTVFYSNHPIPNLVHQRTKEKRVSYREVLFLKVPLTQNSNVSPEDSHTEQYCSSGDSHTEQYCFSRGLSHRTEMKDLGEIMLALCYLPTAGRLTVTVVKAQTLKPVDITGTSDPYVKVCLMCQGKRMKKKKTSVKKDTLNPVYNEALVFDVPAENIEDVNLLVKVLDYDRVGISEIMGCCGLGSGCVGLGRDHWLEMIDNPRKPVAQWHPLTENVQDYQELTQPSTVKCINIG
ncbi:synaptotagmin-6-like, partial [Limulus polyphemus]|uniref:Synaptotagmin-6-like n=1 Tax=Limulus polyphemus TaxID=6850 RepID=A0ABM1RZU3_LIMPO